MNTLPNEIFEIILDLLPTRNLFACRQVNLLWQVVATSICRSRYVRLKEHHEPCDTDRSFSEVFHSYALRDLPWSACSLEDGSFLYDSDPPRSKSDNISRQFLEKFGSTVLDLSVHTMHSDLFEIIQKTRNLHKLQFTLANTEDEDGDTDILDIPDEIFRFPEDGAVKLSHLKHFVVTQPSLTCIERKLGPKSSKLVEFLLKAGAPLKEVDLFVDFTKESMNLPGLMPLLANINTSSLSISYGENQHPSAFLNAIQNKKFYLKKLSVSIELYQWDPEVDDGDEFLEPLPLEHFIENCVQLEELKITIDQERIRTDHFEGVLTLPTLPNLKTLSIPLDVTYNFISRLESSVQQFPILEKFVCKTYSAECFSIIFDQCNNFTNVKEVALEYIYGARDHGFEALIRAFPNTKALSLLHSTKILQGAIDAGVLLHFPCLTELAVDLYDAEKLNTLCFELLSAIVQVSDLQVLKLLRSDSYSEQEVLTDMKISLFLQLKPMELHISSNLIADISVNREKQLRSHHYLIKVEEEWWRKL